MKRRDFLASAAATLAAPPVCTGAAQQPPAARAAAPGRLKHGMTRGSLGPDKSTEQFCREAAELGVQGVDFILPDEFPILKKYGLICSMYRPAWDGREPAARGGVPPTPVVSGGRGPAGPPGWNAMGMKAAMTVYLPRILEAIDVAAANSIPNVIVLAGARSAALSSEQGLDNSVTFCNAAKARAEDRGVTLCMELLNSKGIQAPRMSLFDRTAWGVEMVKRVDSPRVKILYDLFHAQLMEGDLAQTLRDNIQHIAHIHTGGVPGRHEPDDTQEVNYRFLARVLADLKFTGFVTHEWTPAPGSDPIATFRKVLQIMSV
jgi:hydroxypyruvate isomerase